LSLFLADNAFCRDIAMSKWPCVARFAIRQQSQNVAHTPARSPFDSGFLFLDAGIVGRSQSCTQAISPFDEALR
jgi:hypothetical protein